MSLAISPFWIQEAGTSQYIEGNPATQNLLKPNPTPRGRQYHFQDGDPDIEGPKPEDTEDVPGNYYDWQSRALRKRDIALPVLIQDEGFVQRVGCKSAKSQGEEHIGQRVGGALEMTETGQGD